MRWLILSGLVLSCLCLVYPFVLCCLLRRFNSTAHRIIVLCTLSFGPVKDDAKHPKNTECRFPGSFNHCRGVLGFWVGVVVQTPGASAQHEQLDFRVYPSALFLDQSIDRSINPSGQERCASSSLRRTCCRAAVAISCKMDRCISGLHFHLACWRIESTRRRPSTKICDSDRNKIKVDAREDAIT